MPTSICRVCQKKFRTVKALKAHYSKVHGVHPPGIKSVPSKGIY